MEKLSLKRKGKIVSIILAIILLIAIVSILIINKNNSLEKTGVSADLARAMTYGEIEDEDKPVDGTNDCIEFYAYFLRDLDGNGYAEEVKGSCTNASSTDDLYISLNVLAGGTLKNGKITLTDANNINWELNLISDQVVAKNYIESSSTTIELQDSISSGYGAEITAEISVNLGNNIYNYTATNSVTLTGTYVDENGNETEISKTSEFVVDWYGTLSTSITQTTQKHDYEFDEDIELGQEIDIDLNVITSASTNLILKDNFVQVEMATLNGYYPTGVTVSTGGITYEYDDETNILTIYNDSSVNTTSGNMQKTISKINTYKVKVTYPIYETSDTVSLNYKVTSTYTAYNNQNDGFENPVSKTATGNIPVLYSAQDFTGTITAMSTTTSIGTYVKSSKKSIISKEKVVNLYDTGMEDEEEDTYTVAWGFNPGGYSVSGLQIEETSQDKVQCSNGTYIDMSDYISNKGIYFTSFLSSNQYIKIYDVETGELIETFTSDNIGDYRSSSSMYEFEEGVGCIRIETNKSSLYCYIVKEIDDLAITQNFTKEEFNSFSYIYTYAKYTIDIYNQTESTIYNRSALAYYEEEESSFSTSLSVTSMTINETLENEKITISTSTSNYNQKKWTNGSFLVKFSSAVAALEINDVYSYNSDLEILGYDLYKEDGCYYLKIMTSNETATTYSLYIDCDITVKQTESASSITVSVYGANEDSSNYMNDVTDIYDVNNNNDTEDTVGYASASIALQKASTVYTGQTITNYDDEDGLTIAPSIADVERGKTADINITVYNNSKNSISEISILGQIPFEGNTYITNDSSLGSEFTATMLESGIQLPDNLKKYATIYYSSNESVTKDLEDETNGWTTSPSDWSTVKYYLIDLGSYTASTGASFTITYTVKVPEDVDYNKVTYSDYIVYYAENTSHGKHTTYRNASKIGIRAARKYNINLTKYSTEGTNFTVSGATYRVTDGEITRLRTTDKTGEAILKDLYVDKEYTLTEISSAKNYTLNDDEITFKVTEDENGNLNITITSDDTFLNTPIVDSNTNDIYVTVEDEPQYQLEITKKDTNNEELLQGVKFAITSRSGTYSTDAEGKTTIYYLDQHETYTLSEVKAEGYYLLDNIDFRLEKDEKGNFYIISESDEFTNAEITYDESTDTIKISVELENEKKPSIVITKENEDGEKLTGVKIKDTSTNKLYTTDENGQVTIYFEEDTEYTIEETKADGYYLQEITFKIVRDANGKLTIESDNQNFADAVLIDEENKVLSVTLVNEKIPTYTLKINKVDEESVETLLQGAEFQLYELDKSEINTYTTDENGTITIEGLYVYVDGKDLSAEYKLQETTAPDGYSNNAEEIELRVEQNDDETLSASILNEDELETIESVTVEGDIVTVTIKDKPLFKLTKVDSKTGEVLANAEFIIYEIDEDGEIIDYATDVNGEYVGTQDEDGQYIVTTDENGVISLPLKNGSYMIIEISYPEGYTEEDIVEYFKVGTSENEEDTEDKEDTEDIDEVQISKEEVTLDINYIEDLVELSNAVNSKSDVIYNVTLQRNLDFTDDSSYDDPEDTSYGDLNGDGTVEGIKAELTNTSGTGFTPIGQSSTYYFSGTFDGQGYEIQNIYINLSSTDYVGLFGYASNAMMKNIGISGEMSGEISSYSSGIGGIVGYGINVSITNCYNMCSVTNSGHYAGGIVGYGQYILITNCYNTGIITGTSYIGGIIGYGNSGSIKKCYNIGTLNSNLVGGIAGFLIEFDVIDCYNLADITILYESADSYESCYAGGIVGNGNSNSTNIEKCYNTGNITITNNVSMNNTYIYTYSYGGGIAGSSASTISNCYNTGNVITSSTSKNTSTSSSSRCDSYSYSGGIIGYGNSTISNCYNIGDISSSSSSSGGKKTNYSYSYSGSIIGMGSKTVTTNCYYLDSIEIIGSTINEEGTEKSADYMKTEDFINDLGTLYFVLDDKNENNGYPIILSNNTEYTTSIVTSINYIEDLVDFSNNTNSGELYLGKTVTLERTLDFNDDDSYKNPDDTSYGDINGDGTIEGIKAELTNTEGNGFTPISQNIAFSGTFDGQGYEIQNIYINLPSSNYFGLFGNVSDVTIKNLGISGNIIGQYEIGGIVGNIISSSTVYINNCYNNANIVGNELVGGIVGYAQSGNIVYINNCYNNASITGHLFIGGIIGDTNRAAFVNINNCYNTGDITGNYIGGIIGYAWGGTFEFTKCYNTGNIISTNNSSGYYNGGIVGYCNATLKITNCYNTGNITDSNSNSKIGGIVGYCSGTLEITNCYNIGTIICATSDGVGGIVGCSYATLETTNCYNTGNITNENTSSGYVGGIVGYGSATINITSCYNTGLIKDNSGYTGGIIGYESSSGTLEITNCYNSGNLETIVPGGWTYVGGIIGMSYNSITISNCYNDGNIEVSINNNGNNLYIGGIIGYNPYNKLTVTDCYNTSYIIINGTIDGGIYSYVGGILGRGQGNIEKCYNTGNISNNVFATNTNYSYIGGIEGDGGSTIIDCYNVGNISNNTTNTSSSNAAYIGGVKGGYSSGTATNCYNVGEINNKQVSSNYCYTYISGIGGGAISNCYNVGNIINNAGNYMGFGYIGGISYQGTVTNSFNTGNISSSVNYSDSSASNDVGGIIGSGTATNCYNSGNINSVITESLGEINCVGGIAGSGTITNCYNLGNVTSNSTSDKNYIGKIVGYNSAGTVSNSYYLDTVTLSVNKSSTHIINNEGKKKSGVEDYSDIGFYDLRSEEFYNIINENDVWVHVSNYYPKLKIVPTNLSASTELTIGNTIKTFSITTDINEIDGQRGGTISGEDEIPYETVTYGESNTKEVVITTNEGYGISNITVNGATIDYTLADDGSYTIPAGYFTNVQKNISIEVTYSELAQLLVIKKVDEDDESKVLEGATFSIKNTEEPTNTTFSTIVANGTYYFEESTETEGIYVPNGEGDNYSYIEIDLSDKTGNYIINVNAEVIEDGTLCAGITGSTTAISTTSEDGKFIYLTEVTAAADYTSEVLEGGYSYYLQLAYSGTVSGASINSITLYEVEEVETQVEVEIEGEKTTQTVIEYNYLDSGTQFENITKDTDWFYSGEYTTNSNGEIRVSLPTGTYEITEISAPEGYVLDTEAHTVEIGANESNTLTITNKAKPTVVTHYYLKDDEGNYTETKVKEDEIVEYEVNDTYRTSPIAQIGNLTLEKDVNGEYVIPSNAKGTVIDGQIEVTYYYEASPIELTIHHYIDGSNTELASDDVIEIASTVEIDNETNMVTQVSVSEDYELESNETYQELIEIYSLTFVASAEEVLDVGETLTVIENTELTYFYSSEDIYKYTIEYYCDEELEDTYEGEAQLNDVITYVDKYADNEYYTLDKVENSPLVISSDESQNVIKVYYSTNEVWYKVEFYKDDVLQDEDTITKEYIASKEDMITIYDIEIESKYDSYEVSKIVVGDTQVDKMPESVSTGTTIKVYYTKITEKPVYEYTVEYYKDETIVEEDTLKITPEDSQIQENKIIVDSSKITTDNKYEGYVIDYIMLNSEKTDGLPTTVSNGDTIKIYYVKGTYNYRVEYYYDDILDETKTEEKTAVYGEEITTYEDKVIDNYEFSKVEGIPLTISANEEENVIKVYYTKTIEEPVYKYTVEYYYDGILDETKTEEKTATYGEEITTYEDKVIDNYEFSKVEGIPLIISANEEENVIKVYYTKIIEEPVYEYTVEYYKDEIIVEEDTITIIPDESEILDDNVTIIVNSSKVGAENKYEGYEISYFILNDEQEKQETLPTTVVNGDTIKVYYVKGTYNYRVEYYYDDILDETKTEEKTATYGDEITTYEDKVIDKYEFSKVEGIPLIISANEEENVIKVYYTKIIYEYKVEYYKDESIVEDDTLKITPEDSQVQANTIIVDSSKITTDNKYEGYVIDYIMLNDEKTDGLPTTVSNGDTIKIYYVKGTFNYRVEYYYDDILDETKTEEKTATYGDEITTYEDKAIDNYEVSKVEGLPLTISANEEENVIKVYYGKMGTVVVKYINQETEEELADSVEIKGIIGTEYKTEQVNIEHYKLVEKPENETGVITEETIEVIYYYKAIPKGKIIIKYVDVETEEELGTEEIEGYEGETYKIEGKDIEYYDVETKPESEEVVIEEGEKEIVYYYRKQEFNISVEKTIKEITLNGESQKITNNKTVKIEVKSSKIASTELLIKYNIKITNTGKIDGTVEVEDVLPEAVEIVSMSYEWENSVDDNIEAQIELAGGEEKDITVTVRWENAEENLGSIQNVAGILKTSNSANFEDASSTDDTSSAVVIVGIKTGIDENTKFLIEILAGMLMLMTGLVILRKS